MLQPGPRQESLGSPSPEPAPRPQAAPGDQHPTRFLLIRQKPGDLPWLVRALMRYMAPVQVVPVVGMGNALWRLCHERFDAVLLDVEVADGAVLERCREQIADIAAVPVLNLHDAPTKASGARSQRPRPKRAFERGATPVDHHEVARLPWERRAKRQSRKAEREAASVA